MDPLYEAIDDDLVLLFTKVQSNSSETSCGCVKQDSAMNLVQATFLIRNGSTVD